MYGAGVALYPVYSLLNHSCLANTRTRKNRDNVMEVVAQKDIAEGEELFTRLTLEKLHSLNFMSPIYS